ncbi:hypothetical protein J596_0214 [Acinetobacter baumannii 21072]|uniref:Uncharacterized protein n=1 Tax=Acinetobacter baumannii 21072 TaxID=1310697 RepID=A0A062IT56_ACIBA|nr:hypothetical protein [Acinetobacter baumannii]KCY22995.1 hypothetical protein J596_0214 [Acinetobacter baumannii 21072]
MAGKREIKTPGVTAEQNQEQEAQTPDANQDTSTKEKAEAALDHITKDADNSDIKYSDQNPEGYVPEVPEWATAILEGQARLEQKLDAILSQSPNAPATPKAKGRFKLVEGKGHVWTED